jgi:hypothetical protein
LFEGVDIRRYPACNFQKTKQLYQADVERFLLAGERMTAYVDIVYKKSDTIRWSSDHLSLLNLDHCFQDLVKSGFTPN